MYQKQSLYLRYESQICEDTGLRSLRILSSWTTPSFKSVSNNGLHKCLTKTLNQNYSIMDKTSWHDQSVYSKNTSVAYHKCQYGTINSSNTFLKSVHVTPRPGDQTCGNCSMPLSESRFLGILLKNPQGILIPEPIWKRIPEDLYKIHENQKVCNIGIFTENSAKFYL